MDELTEVQSIRLGDFKEQLASIKTNIAIANKELEATLEKKRLADESFELTSAQKAEVLSGLSGQIAEITDGFEKKMQAINSETVKLDADKLEFDKYKNKIEAELVEDAAAMEKDRVADEQYREKLRDDIAKLEKVCDRYLEKSSDYLKKHNRIESDMLKVSAAKQKLTGELADLDLEKSNKLAEFDKEKVKLTKELTDLKKQVKAEADKVTVPRESLHAEMEKFKQDKADVVTMYARTQRLYSAMYPNKTLEEINISE